MHTFYPNRLSGGIALATFLPFFFKFSTEFSLFPRIFGHEDQTAADIVYINWLNMVRAGVLGLEFYTPETTSWRQVCNLEAHSEVCD